MDLTPGQKIMLGQITGSLLAKAGSGDFGELPKTIYWWLRGHKTEYSVWLGVPSLLLEFLGWAGACEAAGLPCAHWSTALVHVTTGASAFLFYLGQVDGALHIEAPPKPGV